MKLTVNGGNSLEVAVGVSAHHLDSKFAFSSKNLVGFTNEFTDGIVFHNQRFDEEKVLRVFEMTLSLFKQNILELFVVF